MGVIDMLVGMVNVGGGIEGFVEGTATHTRTDGMTLTGLLAPPKLFILFNYGNYAQNSYSTFAMVGDWNGTSYDSRFGFDADGYGYEESGSPKILNVTAAYSNGTFNIKTGCSRFNGAQWYYRFVY